MMLATTATMTNSDTTNLPFWALALKMRRMERRLTQEELAAKTEGQVAQRTVSNLETARTHIKEVGLGRAMALADALDWTFFQFLSNLELTAEDFKPESLPVIEPPVHPSFYKFVEKMSDEYPELNDSEVQSKLQKMYFFDNRLDSFRAWNKAFELYLEVTRKRGSARAN